MYSKLSSIPTKLLLLILALLLAACGGDAGREAPTGATGILEHAREAMGELTSARYTATFAHDDAGQPMHTLNEWAGPDRYRATTTHGLEDGREMAGVVLRIDNESYLQDPREGTWVKRIYLHWSPREGTGLSALIPELVDVRRLEDTDIDGVPVFHIAGEALIDHPPAMPSPLPVAGHMQVSLYIDRDEFLVRRMEAGNETHQWWSIHEFFDFNASIRLEPPDDWEEAPVFTPSEPPPPPTLALPLPAATLAYEPEGVIAEEQWPELLEVVRHRLAAVGAEAAKVERSGGRLIVDLPADTLPVERAEFLIGSTGRVELFERVCATPRCERPGEFEDRHIDITDANIQRATPSQVQPGDNYSVLLEADRGGAVRLAEATQRISGTNATASPDQLVVTLDGEVLVAARVRAPILAGSMEVAGTFTLEEAYDTAAVLDSGRLPVPLTLVNSNG